MTRPILLLFPNQKMALHHFREMAYRIDGKANGVRLTIARSDLPDLMFRSLDSFHDIDRLLGLQPQAIWAHELVRGALLHEVKLCLRPDRVLESLEAVL